MSEQDQRDFYNRAIADAQEMIEDAKRHIKLLKQSIRVFEHFRDTGVTFDFLNKEQPSTDASASVLTQDVESV